MILHNLRYTTLPNGRRIIAGGLIREGTDLIFQKHVKADHHFRQSDGWGLDVGLLEQLKQRGVSTIRVISRYGIETTALDNYFAFGRRVAYGNHGGQIVLQRKFFRNAADPQLDLFGVTA